MFFDSKDSAMASPIILLRVVLVVKDSVDENLTTSDFLRTLLSGVGP